jgi:hypothetical protein
MAQLIIFAESVEPHWEGAVPIAASWLSSQSRTISPTREAAAIYRGLLAIGGVGID